MAADLSAEQQIAELIDEVVFQQRQNEQLQRRVAELEAANSALQTTAERVHILEEQIKQNEADRTAVAQSFEVLQTALEASGNPLALQQAAATHANRSSALEAEIRALRQAAEATQLDAESMQRKHEAVVADLRKKLIHAQQSQRALGSPTASLLGIVVPDSDAERSREGDIPKAKLRAFEMTVSALNAELAHLEEKIVSMEASFREDRDELQRRMDAERERFEREQAECDSVVAHVSAELEQCMKENQDLRNRLQAQFVTAPKRG